MIFSYKAVSRDGGRVSGELNAQNKREATRVMLSRGLTVVSIEQSKSNQKVLKKRSSPEDLMLSLHEMATLLESGVSVAETIEAQSNSHYPPDLSERYLNMADEIRKGSSFSDAMKTADFPVPSYFLQLLKAGELTGNLGLSLRSGVSQFEYDMKSREDIVSALIYPLILVGSGIAAVLLIFLFVVPKFAPLVDRSSDLPLLSLLVLNGGMWFNENASIFLFFAFLSCVAGYWLFQRNDVRRGVKSFAFRIPIVGGWLDEADVAMWTAQMSTLLSGKVSLLEALDLSSVSVFSERRRSLLKEVERDIRAGEGLADSLEKADCLNTTGYNLLRSGERAGKLPEMMLSLAHLYEEASKRRMQRMLSLLEPLAIIVIGCVIGMIIIGVILAVTSANELVI